MCLWEPGSHMTARGGGALLLPLSPVNRQTDWLVCLSPLGSSRLLLSGERLGLPSPGSPERLPLALYFN